MLEQLDQMGLEHVPRVMLVNTRQQQDLLHVLCARAASFLQWRDRIRMSALAMLAALDPTALEHAHRVIMAATKQKLGLLHALPVRLASFRR